MKNNWITIQEAENLRLCRKCNFAGRLKKQIKPCDYHRHGESMNFRNVPSGMCALRTDDIKRMQNDYGCDRHGKLSLK